MSPCQGRVTKAEVKGLGSLCWGLWGWGEAVVPRTPYPLLISLKQVVPQRWQEMCVKKKTATSA